MSNTVVGTLTIDLIANTASFERSMGSMNTLSARTANEIKKSLEKISAAGIAMATAIATGTAALINKALETADSLGKAAQAAGTTAETFSVLNYAAELTGTSTEALTKGLEKLSQSAFKAQNGNAQLERIYSRLKISVSDSNGHLKDSGVLLEEVAARFAGMQDGPGKTALAMQLFGKAGAALIPMLDKLGAEQNRINEDAHAFGLVLSTSTVQVANEAKENMERLGAALKGMGFTLLAGTLPALQELLEKLVEIGKSSTFQQMVRAFSTDVSKAIKELSAGLQFVENHATALRRVLEGLAAVKIGGILAPAIKDLADGGIEKLGAGVSRFVTSALGISKAIPAISEFGNYVKTTAFMVKGLAEEEGLAAAGMYALDALMLTNPFVLAGIAIAGTGAALYGLRDAMIKVEGESFKMKDLYAGMWDNLKSNIHETGSELGGFFGAWFDFDKRLALDWHNTVISALKSTGLTEWIGDAITIAENKLEEFAKWVLGWSGKLLALTNIPDELIKQKGLREGKIGELSKPGVFNAPGAPTGMVGLKEKPQPDTSGLGKEQENPTAILLANLRQQLNASQQTLAAAGLEEAAQRKVTAANQANNEIVKLGEQLAKQRGITTKDYAALVDAKTQAEIRTTTAEIAENKAMAELRDQLGNAARSSAAAIAQANQMTVAIGRGNTAIQQQAAITQAWNELRAKGASLAQIQTRAEGIYSEAIAKETQNIAAEIRTLQQEIAAKQLEGAAMLGTVEQQREAALGAKVYAINQQIATTAAGELRDALIRQRDAMVQLNGIENQAADAQRARELLSPVEQYNEEIAALKREVIALADAKNGEISYGEQLQIMAKEQDAFNKLTDETVNGLLRFGSASDGVKAFFLDMQKQATSTAKIVYDALKQSFDGLSDQLTKLVTGGKTDFGKMFSDIGKEMLQATIKQQLQKGLGGLAGKLGIQLGGAYGGKDDKKPLGTEKDPLWVKMAAAAGKGAGDASGASDEEFPGENDEGDDGADASGGGGMLGSLTGMFGKAGGFFSSILGKLGGMFSSIIGGGGGGGLGSMLGGLAGAFAGGGTMGADGAYMVGEQGPEILSGVSGRISSNLESRRMLANTSAPLYGSLNIDARGTDPVLTEQRTKQAIFAAHSSAVTNSVQAHAEQAKRTTSQARATR